MAAEGGFERKQAGVEDGDGQHVDGRFPPIQPQFSHYDAPTECATGKAKHPKEGHENVHPVLGNAVVVLQVLGQEHHVALQKMIF